MGKTAILTGGAANRDATPPLSSLSCAEIEAAFDAISRALHDLNLSCNEPRMSDTACALIDAQIRPLDQLASSIFEEVRRRTPESRQDAEARGRILVGYALLVGIEWAEVSQFAVETLGLCALKSIH